MKTEDFLLCGFAFALTAILMVWIQRNFSVGEYPLWHIETVAWLTCLLLALSFLIVAGIKKVIE